MKKSVLAIVVTFNRPELLKTCLMSLRNQWDSGLTRIHVVVNSNDQETLSVIHATADGVLITHTIYDNPGPAGGFNYGLKEFLASDSEYCWLMDDDVIAADGCLKELLSCAKDRQYIYPRVIKGDGKEIVSFGWWGVLLERSLVLRAGLPVADLFFWKEDTEYLQNRLLRICKVPPLRCQNAMVRHLHARNRRRPSWYYYYTTRNTLYYHQYIVGYTWYRLKKTLILFPHSLYAIMFREQNKLRKLRLLLLGVLHGMRGKIGKLVDPTTNG